MTIDLFEGGTLFGMPHSYYTGPARAYLRQQGARFTERSPSDPAYTDEIMPAIRRWIIPVFRTADGRIIQDSLDIILAGEAAGAPRSAMPPGERQRLLSAVFFLFGSQGMLKPAMHYRWSYYDEQQGFLDHAFGITDDPQSRAGMDKMRGLLPILGVTPDTIPAIEADFATLIGLLDAHFATHPYLFGGQPSLGDYGLFGPLYAHLGRDPYPANLMKNAAPNLYRWSERMHAGSFDDRPEFADARGFLVGDAVPDTLMPVLDHIGESFAPELAARLGHIRDWLEESRPEDGAVVGDKPSRRAIGTTAVPYGGVETVVAVQPYLLYCQRQVETAWSAMTDAGRDWGREALGARGLAGLIDPDLPMTVGRRDNVEIWESRG